MGDETENIRRDDVQGLETPPIGLARRCLSVVLRAIALAGFASFLVGFLCCFVGNSDWLSEIEFPLSHGRTVIEDDAGNVYVGLQFYSRIQIYDSRGRFLRGVFVHNGGGMFDFYLDADGNLKVYSFRPRMLSVFHRSGALVREELSSDAVFYASKSLPLYVKNPAEYAIESPILFPQIYRRRSDENWQLFLSNPWFYFPLLPPFNCLLTAVICGAIRYRLRRPE